MARSIYNHHYNMTKPPYVDLERGSEVCTVLAMGGYKIRIPRRRPARRAAGATSSTLLHGDASSGAATVL